MNATSVRHLSLMAQEGDQEVLIWGATTEMIVVAEEAMIGAATGAEAGTEGASEGAGVVGTEAVLALARWTPGVSTDRIAGRGHISPASEVLKNSSSSCTQCYPCYFVNFQFRIAHGIFFCVCVCVRLP